MGKKAYWKILTKVTFQKTSGNTLFVMFPEVCFFIKWNIVDVEHGTCTQAIALLDAIYLRINLMKKCFCGPPIPPLTTEHATFKSLS